MSVESAVGDAFRAGNALCKFISRNDVGETGGHQCGFYLPKSAWTVFSVQPPVKGKNYKEMVRIEWPGEIYTDSAVTWYGCGTRSEYRLTRFGRDFEWLKEKYVGALLVLIPFSVKNFKAYVFSSEDDIEGLKASLGIELLDGWGVFFGGRPKSETEDECLDRVFNADVSSISDFPNGRWMADNARAAVDECVGSVSGVSADDLILKWIDAEYRLFRCLENKLCLSEIRGPFSDIERFISIAATIMNRRKSRAGHSLEYHVEHLFRALGVPFDSQAKIDGKIKPDILIPGKDAYENPAYPVSKMVVMGLKTTCKDRWRQVLNEGKRIPEKHLLTLQPAISKDQLSEMRDANVTLVVPRKFHTGYDLKTGIRLLSLEQFVGKIKALVT